MGGKNYKYIKVNILCPNSRIQIEVFAVVATRFMQKIKKNSTWRKAVETLELDKLRP